jgi:hypothetical protein
MIRPYRASEVFIGIILLMISVLPERAGLHPAVQRVR